MVIVLLLRWASRINALISRCLIAGRLGWSRLLLAVVWFELSPSGSLSSLRLVVAVLMDVVDSSLEEFALSGHTCCGLASLGVP